MFPTGHSDRSTAQEALRELVALVQQLPVDTPVLSAIMGPFLWKGASREDRTTLLVTLQSCGGGELPADANGGGWAVIGKKCRTPSRFSRFSSHGSLRVVVERGFVSRYSR